MGDSKAAVEHFVALAASRFEGATEAVEAVAQLRSQPLTATARYPAWPPACRHWQRLLDLAHAQGQGDMADALRPLGGVLGWMGGGDFYPEAEALRDKLAYADVVGPYGGLYSADGYHLGPIIFAPHMDYPPHGHPAAELYYVVAGEAKWRRGGEDWTLRGAGSLIHHPPNMPHAARTADGPVLALVCLTGDLDAPPMLL